MVLGPVRGCPAATPLAPGAESRGGRVVLGLAGPVVFALRELVANGLPGLTWGLIAAATVRSWRDERRSGRARGQVWTEEAAVVDAVVVALLLAAGVGLLRPFDIVRWAPFWIASVALLSWWLTGRFGPWHNYATRAASASDRARPARSAQEKADRRARFHPLPYSRPHDSRGTRLTRPHGIVDSVLFIPSGSPFRFRDGRAAVGGVPHPVVQPDQRSPRP